MLSLVLLNGLLRLEFQAYRAVNKKVMVLKNLQKLNFIFSLTSFVLRFGVEREELEPERDGGRSLLSLLDPAFSPFLSPLSPILSRSRDSE